MNLNEQFAFRCTAPERKLIFEAARKNGLKPGTWVREIVVLAAREGFQVGFEKSFLKPKSSKAAA